MNNTRQQQITATTTATSSRRPLHAARSDRSENVFKGPQSLAPNIEELKHHILTTGLPTTSNGIVYTPQFNWMQTADGVD
jgi:hypothetical protein